MHQALVKVLYGIINHRDFIEIPIFSVHICLVRYYLILALQFFIEEESLQYVLRFSMSILSKQIRSLTIRDTASKWFLADSSSAYLSPLFL